MARVLRLLEAGHGGNGFWYYSRPVGKGFESDWRTAGPHREPRAAWRNDNIFVSANPHAEIPATNARGEKTSPKWVRGTGDNILSVGWLFCEIDAKDTITEAEWLPYYVEPDVSGLTNARARGALQKAQTAAIDAALVDNLVEYKRRALAAMAAITPRATAAWDSGGGCWGVWAFDAPVALTDDNRADVARVQKAWVERGGGDPAASDLNRVFRMPGTVNHKKKYGPNGHPVVFLWYDLAVRYSFVELAALVPEQPAAKSVKARRVYVPAGLPATLGEFADVPKLPYHPAIDAYNAQTGIHDLLLEYGYTDAGSGRMNRPGGDTAGVQLHNDNTASIYSSADPLYCGHRVTPAHALCVFEHDGKIDAMLDALTGGHHARFLAEVDDMRLWARTTHFAAYAPEYAHELKHTDSNDTKMIDTCCDLWAEAGDWTTKPIGKKRLGARSGMTPNAALAALKRLALFAVDITQTERDGWIISKKTPCSENDPCSVDTLKKGSFSLHGKQHNEYSPRKRHDAYQSGTSRRMREKAAELAPTLEMEPREWLKRFAPGLGEKGLRIMDAMHRCGEMTAQELADETGKSVHTIREGLRQLHTAGLVECDDLGPFAPKVWELVPLAFKKAEANAYQMRTAGMEDSREERQLEHSQLWAVYEGVKATTREDREKAEAKLRWLTRKRKECITRMRPHWSQDVVSKYAEEIPFRQWLQKRAELQMTQRDSSERTEKHHEAALRMHYAAIVEENTAMSDDLAEYRAMARAQVAA